MKISSCPDARGHKEINNGPGRKWVRNQELSAKGIVQLYICDFFLLQESDCSFSSSSPTENEGVPGGQEPHYQAASQARPSPENPGRK